MGMELVFIIGAVALGGALAFATIRNRQQRNRINDAVTEAATRAAYKRPDTYDENQFKRMLQPRK